MINWLINMKKKPKDLVQYEFIVWESVCTSEWFKFWAVTKVEASKWEQMTWMLHCILDKQFI